MLNYGNLLIAFMKDISGLAFYNKQKQLLLTNIPPRCPHFTKAMRNTADVIGGKPIAV
jgi:hypothetical protein